MYVISAIPALDQIIQFNKRKIKYSLLTIRHYQIFEAFVVVSSNPPTIDPWKSCLVYEDLFQLTLKNFDNKIRLEIDI